MGASNAEPSQIYQFRAVLRGVTPLVWRRLLLRNDQSVAHLHEVLQVAFGWENEHLHRFVIRGRDYGVHYVGGLSFYRDARDAFLSDLGLRIPERFVYEYDMGDYWVHDVHLEAVLPTDASKQYPGCIGGQGAAPPEDSGGAAAFMERRWQYALIGRGESREELEDLVDDLEDDEWETLRHYDPDRFDRRAINRALATLTSGSLEGALYEIHCAATNHRRRRTPRHHADHHD